MDEGQVVALFTLVVCAICILCRKKYDPKAYSAEGGLIFDAAVQR